MSKKYIDISLQAIDRGGKEEKLRTDEDVMNIMKSMFQNIVDHYPDESEKIGLMDVVSNALDILEHTRTRIRLTDTQSPKNYSLMNNYGVPFDYHIDYLELPESPGPLFQFVDTTNGHSFVFGIGAVGRKASISINLFNYCLTMILIEFTVILKFN